MFNAEALPRSSRGFIILQFPWGVLQRVGSEFNQGLLEGANSGGGNWKSFLKKSYQQMHQGKL